MYRVELKDIKRAKTFSGGLPFLMYRVELKDIKEFREPMVGGGVPNVPCGVESSQEGA